MKQSNQQRRNRVTTTIYLDPEQIKALRRLDERTKVPTAVRIRECIDMVLMKYWKAKK